ncbi:MAG: hypothetical protein M5U34_15000 [Chloroflexi bacterium]|nr:hypothetical protein [Chloroflexota bacterium]
MLEDAAAYFDFAGAGRRCTLKNLCETPRSHMLRSAFLDDTVLLVPALGYFAFALTTDINLGYRHLLPILPFLAVFTANSLSPYLTVAGRLSVTWSRRC